MDQRAGLLVQKRGRQMRGSVAAELKPERNPPQRPSGPQRRVRTPSLASTHTHIHTHTYTHTGAHTPGRALGRTRQPRSAEHRALAPPQPRLLAPGRRPPLSTRRKPLDGRVARRPGELAAETTLPVARCRYRATAGGRGAPVDPGHPVSSLGGGGPVLPQAAQRQRAEGRLLLTGAAAACSVELQPETRLAAWKALQEAEERACLPRPHRRPRPGGLGGG